jgi:hypothetical protein
MNENEREWKSIKGALNRIASERESLLVYVEQSHYSVPFLILSPFRCSAIKSIWMRVIE